eukprot:1166969_1
MFNRFIRKLSRFATFNSPSYGAVSSVWIDQHCMEFTKKVLVAATVPFIVSSTSNETDKEELEHKSEEMNTIIFGSGEYVTGFTGKEAVKSDKSMGVVGLVCFDLRKRGLIGSKIAICGTNGDKFIGIRKHFDTTIKQIFYNTFRHPDALQFTSFPEPGVRDTKAYKKALLEFSTPGDVCIIFTPDDTHFEIVEAAIDRGLHVLCTKPFVKTLDEHLYLVEKARQKGVLLQIEVHKRYDPMYNDAVNRIKELGEFNYFVSYMSQPKLQLDTFKSWAGISSDISYYLNSHHIDIHMWAMQGKAKCTQVHAFASNNVTASKMLNRECEDTITICATWQDKKNKKSIGHAVYTSSWTAIKADVHSQQRFFCLMENGEINIDQAHRGYTVATDDSNGVNHINPLYMRNIPDNDGNYCSQNGYGYVSFERFVRAAKLINDGEKTPEEFDPQLPTGNVTAVVTAMLEAGRISLDNDNRAVMLQYDQNDNLIGLQLEQKY